MQTQQPNPPRPGLKRANYQRRVAFIAHVLTYIEKEGASLDEILAAQEKSTQWIVMALHLLGMNIHRARVEQVEGFVWLSFPVHPRQGSSAHPVWVDFYIIPVPGRQFLGSCRSKIPGEPSLAYGWVERVALKAILEAKRDQVHLTVGFGAFTKNATDHGREFIERHPMLVEQESLTFTHGDSGTVALTLREMEQAKVAEGLPFVIYGANGAIGDAMARMIGRFKPSHVRLVGRPDKPGEQKNRLRLAVLRSRVTQALEPDVLVDIWQDHAMAAHGLEGCVAITATNGSEFTPAMFPKSARIFDLATPSACPRFLFEGEREVHVSGCGVVSDPDTMLPEWFGKIDGHVVRDIGAGPPGVVSNSVAWGCFWETVADAAHDVHGFGFTQIPITQEMVAESERNLDDLGVVPQPQRGAQGDLAFAEVSRTGDLPFDLITG